MNKKLFNKLKVKDQASRIELARAHGIIVMLSLSLIFTLTFAAAIDVDLNPILTFSASVLLGLVALLSLSVVVSMLKQRKK